VQDAISNVFPKARHQSCWVHLSRNVAHAVRVKDRTEVLTDLKNVYTQDTLEAAEEKLDSLIQT
jgi:transposase-like protein